MTSPAAIEFLSAVIVTSPEPDRLAGFYADALGVPPVGEQHDEDLPHWGATLGQLHFAIHHPDDFPEHRAGGAGSVVIAFTVEDLEGTVARLRQHGVEPLYPTRDLGWTQMTRRERAGP
jgi:catechol 2,3-dioxygenase-like lactoylglutathione lyase family enzyme